MPFSVRRRTESAWLPLPEAFGQGEGSRVFALVALGFLFFGPVAPEAAPSVPR